MTGRRPDREPFEAIEAGLRRLRYLGLAMLALAVVLPGGHRPDAIGAGLLLGLVILAIVADRAPSRLDPGSGSADRLVALQIGVDVVVTVGALLVIDPAPADGIWLIVAFPVVEGAIRYGILGGVAVWLATAVPVAGWAIVNWSPGDGLSTMTETGGLLAIALAVGLPAGSLADHLVDELRRQHLGRADLNGQAQLISALAVAAGDLPAKGPEDIGQTLVEAAVQLGFPGAEMVTVDLQTWANQPVTSEPPGFATAVMAGPELVNLAGSLPGTVRISSVDEWVGVIGTTKTTMTVLAVGAEDAGRWGPRGEAFELLCRYGAVAMIAIGQRRRLAEASRQLDHRQNHDPVTGLLNRPGFEVAVAAVLDQLMPGDEAKVFAIDLDRFAAVNSTAGWATGDQVLAEIGARLGRATSASTAVARLDADLFALVTDDRGAAYLQQHLRDILARPITTAHGPMTLAASVGQVLTADPTYAPTALIREAELRVRAAKALESNRTESLK